MKRGTTKSPAVGRRVEIPAYCDLWVRGARFGEVVRVIQGGSYFDPCDPRGRTLFCVRMEHPQVTRLVRVIANDCRYIG